MILIYLSTKEVSMVLAILENHCFRAIGKTKCKQNMSKLRPQLASLIKNKNSISRYDMSFLLSILFGVGREGATEVSQLTRDQWF